MCCEQVRQRGGAGVKRLWKQKTWAHLRWLLQLPVVGRGHLPSKLRQHGFDCVLTVPVGEDVELAGVDLGSHRRTSAVRQSTTGKKW